MGACTFIDIVSGPSANRAFEERTQRARHDHGHAGYTGTIAEKHDFVQIPFSPTDAMSAVEEARALAQKLLNEGDPRIDDKWGPAGCIAVGNGEFIFFGWASS